MWAVNDFIWKNVKICTLNQAGEIRLRENDNNPSLTWGDWKLFWTEELFRNKRYRRVKPPKVSFCGRPHASWGRRSTVLLFTLLFWIPTSFSSGQEFINREAFQGRNEAVEHCLPPWHACGTPEPAIVVITAETRSACQHYPIGRGGTHWRVLCSLWL